MLMVTVGGAIGVAAPAHATTVTATISGTIVDATGQPMPNVYVASWHPAGRHALQTFAPGASTTTNAAGKYTLHIHNTGRYKIFLLPPRDEALQHGYYSTYVGSGTGTTFVLDPAPGQGLMYIDAPGLSSGTVRWFTITASTTTDAGTQHLRQGGFLGPELLRCPGTTGTSGTAFLDPRTGPGPNGWNGGVIPLDVNTKTGSYTVQAPFPPGAWEQTYYTSSCRFQQATFRPFTIKPLTVTPGPRYFRAPTRLTPAQLPHIVGTVAPGHVVQVAGKCPTGFACDWTWTSDYGSESSRIDQARFTIPRYLHGHRLWLSFVVRQPTHFDLLTNSVKRLVA
jgi:hypothetical protein